MAVDDFMGFRDNVYRLIVENAAEGIWLINARGISLFVNERFSAMLGYSSEDIMGRHLFDFMDESSKEVCLACYKQKDEDIKHEHVLNLKKKGRLMDKRAVYRIAGKGF